MNDCKRVIMKNSDTGNIEVDVLVPYPSEVTEELKSLISKEMLEVYLKDIKYKINLIGKSVYLEWKKDKGDEVTIPLEGICEKIEIIENTLPEKYHVKMYEEESNNG